MHITGLRLRVAMAGSTRGVRISVVVIMSTVSRIVAVGFVPSVLFSDISATIQNLNNVLLHHFKKYLTNYYYFINWRQ